MLIKQRDSTLKNSIDISVIIPVYDDKRIINCLNALCAQKFKGIFEIIVVENDKTQKILKLIKNYKITYLCCHKKGSYFTRNMGINHAKGKIIVFTDADCIANKDWLKKIWQTFQNPEINIIAGKILNKIGNAKIQKYQREFLITQGLQYLTPISPLPYMPTANIAYRNHILKELKGFDTQFKSGGDVDISWRAQYSGYKLTFLTDAIIQHEGRTSFFKYFRQFYNYGIGHVLLFKKHKKINGKKFVFNPYPFKGLIRALSLGIIKGLFHLCYKRDVYYIKSCYLDTLEHSALLLSALIGSLRYKVLYI
ncbi:MAG: hypothetical protein AMS24_04930 [Chlamydiae bacterium SM23_39]|nr:MAG: hypothetical protein AMS24_04930 [Chlamydiae bacterium SM23_39]